MRPGPAWVAIKIKELLVVTNAKQSEAAARRYRYDHPRVYPDILNDMYIKSTDLGPGDTIQPFSLLTTDGAPLRSADAFRDAQPILFVFGSLTCPVTESAVPGLKRLYMIYGTRIRFVMINVREAHPGAALPQPKTAEQKWQRARELKKRHDLPFEVAVDDIDGTFHRAFGARPNSAYIIDHRGKVLFRAQWANEGRAIGEALAAIANGRTPPQRAVTRTFHAMTQMIGYMKPVLSAAGRGATLDTWKVALPLGILMILSGVFAFLPKQKRGLPSMILFALLAIACASVILG